MEKYKYLENVIKNCLYESIEEYKDIPYSNYRDWSNGLSKTFSRWYKQNDSDEMSTGISPGDGAFPQTDGGDIFVYHACKRESVMKFDENGRPILDSEGKPVPGGILENGFSRRYCGTSCCCVGSGIYCTITPTENTNVHQFGGSRSHPNAIVKCILVGGLKNFIFFSEGLRNKYDKGATIKDEFLRFMSPEKLNELERLVGDVNNLSGLGRRSRSRAEYDFLPRLLGHQINRHPNLKLRIPDADSTLQEEHLLNGTGIRGFVYEDGYGEVVVVRDINSLIPYQYRIDRRSDKWRFAISDEDTFNRINTNTDVYWKYSNKYPKTHFYSTSTAGHSLVSDENGEYLMNDRTGEPVFQFPIKGLTDLNPYTNTTDFKHNGKDYRLFVVNGRYMVRELRPNQEGTMTPIGRPLKPEDLQR